MYLNHKKDMLDSKAIMDWLRNNSPHKLIQRRWYYHSYFKKPCEIINEKKSHEFEIYTIAFNNDKVIDYQIKFMKKNFKDEHLHIIVDNSSDNEISEKIRKICIEQDTMYIRLPENNLFTSQSHALALNYTCKNIIDKRWCKYFGFLDHDIFPIKKTTILPYLKRQKMYGYLLDREKLEYARNARTIWPGFCFFDKSISKKFDFRPIKSLFPLYALDTWGKNYKLLFRRYDKNKLDFPSKHLIWVKENKSEIKIEYKDVANYSIAEKYMENNKMLYTYEYIMDKKRIHRSATYFVGNWRFSHEQYEELLNQFYRKLDILL